MPALLKSTDIAGTVTDETAKACGLVSGILLSAAVATVSAAPLALAVPRKALPTAVWVHPHGFPSPLKNQSTMKKCAPLPGRTLCRAMYCQLGPCSGGGSYSWFTKELCKYESLLGEQQGVSKYDLLEQEINDSKPGANGLLFLPYLIGERSPRWNPKAKGAFIGLKMETEKKDMVRAVQEGVAFNLGVVMDVFKGKGVAIDDMIVIGGGAQSDAWLQILADVYNINIQKPNYLEEATSMGAAITAGVGVGVFENFDVIDKFLKIEETKTPNTDNQPVYSAMKPILRSLFCADRGL